MSRRNVLNSAPWSVPVIVAACFAVIEAVSKYSPSLVLRIVPLVTAIATFAACWGGFTVARRRGRSEALALSSTATLLVPAAFGCYLITEAAYGRYAYAAAAVLLLSFYLAYLRGIIRTDARFTAEDFSHLSFTIHVVTIFFAWYAVGALPEFVNFPLAGAVAVASLIAFAASAETMRRSGLKLQRALHIGGVMAVLAAELFLAISFLPTSHFANAAVGTVLFVTGLHAAVFYLVRAPLPSNAPFRRQLAFSVLLVVIVLSTARWA